MTVDQMVREDMRVMFEDEQVELLPPRTTMGRMGGGNGRRGNNNVTQTAVAVAQINQFGLINVNFGDATATAVNVNS